MRAVSIFSAGLICGCTFLLLAQPPSSQGTANRIAGPTGMDQQILSKMHHVNQIEINVGKLTEQKSDDPEVKRYGRCLVRDHELGDRKVAMVAKQLNLTLMTPQPQTPEEHQEMQMQMQMVDKLKTLSGKAFDNTFLPAMVQGHIEAITMLKNAEGKLPEQSPVRMLISKLLPILEQHQQLAEDLQKQGR